MLPIEELVIESSGTKDGRLTDTVITDEGSFASVNLPFPRNNATVFVCVCVLGGGGGGGVVVSFTWTADQFGSKLWALGNNFTDSSDKTRVCACMQPVDETWFFL